jgi:hypothetical protein
MNPEFGNTTKLMAYISSVDVCNMGYSRATYAPGSKRFFFNVQEVRFVTIP